LIARTINLGNAKVPYCNIFRKFVLTDQLKEIKAYAHMLALALMNQITGASDELSLNFNLPVLL